MGREYGRAESGWYDELYIHNVFIRENKSNDDDADKTRQGVALMSFCSCFRMIFVLFTFGLISV